LVVTGCSPAPRYICRYTVGLHGYVAVYPLPCPPYIWFIAVVAPPRTRSGCPFAFGWFPHAPLPHPLAARLVPGWLLCCAVSVAFTHLVHGYVTFTRLPRCLYAFVTVPILLWLPVALVTARLLPCRFPAPAVGYPVYVYGLCAQLHTVGCPALRGYTPRLQFTRLLLAVGLCGLKARLRRTRFTFIAAVTFGYYGWFPFYWFTVVAFGFFALFGCTRTRTRAVYLRTLVAAHVARLFAWLVLWLPARCALFTFWFPLRCVYLPTFTHAWLVDLVGLPVGCYLPRVVRTRAALRFARGWLLFTVYRCLARSCLAVTLGFKHTVWLHSSSFGLRAAVALRVAAHSATVTRGYTALHTFTTRFVVSVGFIHCPRLRLFGSLRFLAPFTAAHCG